MAVSSSFSSRQTLDGYSTLTSTEGPGSEQPPHSNHPSSPTPTDTIPTATATVPFPPSLPPFLPPTHRSAPVAQPKHRQLVAPQALGQQRPAAVRQLLEGEGGGCTFMIS